MENFEIMLLGLLLFKKKRKRSSNFQKKARKKLLELPINQITKLTFISASSHTGQATCILRSSTDGVQMVSRFQIETKRTMLMCYIFSCLTFQYHFIREKLHCYLLLVLQSDSLGECRNHHHPSVAINVPLSNVDDECASIKLVKSSVVSWRLVYDESKRFRITHTQKKRNGIYNLSRPPRKS